MALIKCPECGKEISDNAQNCPQCGYPLKGSATKGEDNPSIGTAKGSQQTSQPVPKKKKNGCLVGCLPFFIIFAVLIFIISSIGGKSTKILKSRLRQMYQRQAYLKQKLKKKI